MKILKRFVWGITALIILAMMAATLLEKAFGTEYAYTHVYGSPAFLCAWGVMAAGGLVYLLTRRSSLRPAVLLLHLSWLVILGGALLTHLTGRQGSLHLRTGEPQTAAYTGSDGVSEQLPFSIRLQEFHIEYYQGTLTPMDFISRIQIYDKQGNREGTVSMNRIFTHRSYRFYQSSYDDDGQGTTLSVACDPWGITVTYTGYALLLVSITGFFFDRRSHFRRLLNHPLLRKALLILVFIPSFTLKAAPNVLPEPVAAEMGCLYVFHNGRICPLQTLAREFTLKLYGKASYREWTAEQVLTGWMFYHSSWKEEPLFRIKDRTTRQLLGLHGTYARATDFIGQDGSFKLEQALQKADAPARQAIGEASEKFNLASMAATGTLIRIFPVPDKVHHTLQWCSQTDRLPKDMADQEWLFIRRALSYVQELVFQHREEEAIRVIRKIRTYQEKVGGAALPGNSHFLAEIIYNRCSHPLPVASLLLTAGLVGFLLALNRFIHEEEFSRREYLILNTILILAWAYQLFTLSLRGYVSGHFPLANGFETMQFMSACALILTFFFQRKFVMILPCGLLVSGLAQLVSTLGESNPAITPLLPVLSSPLLSLHVTVIMIAYSLLACIWLNGLTALLLQIRSKKHERLGMRLAIASRIMLYPAVFCLAAGIFIGAVWANVSWGRYWGWDPKEVWALITLLIYSTALHPISLPAFQKPIFFHIFAVVAFLSVLVTYFGVNFLLGGMHSYAAG